MLTPGIPLTDKHINTFRLALLVSFQLYHSTSLYQHSTTVQASTNQADKRQIIQCDDFQKIIPAMTSQV